MLLIINSNFSQAAKSATREAYNLISNMKNGVTENERFLNKIVQLHNIGIDPTAREDRFGSSTLLHRAIEKKLYKTIKILTKSNGWENIVNFENETPLSYAAALKEKKIFNLLLSRSTQFQDIELVYKLYLLKDWQTLYRYLLKTNNVFWINFIQHPLQIPARAGPHVEGRVFHIHNLLYGLISEQRTECLTVLLHKGIPPNLQNSDSINNTLLHYAVIKGNNTNHHQKTTLKQLLLFGADPYIKNVRGQTVLDIASPEIKDYILKGQACIQLVKHFGHLQDPKIIALYFNLTPEGRLFFTKYAITQPNQSGTQNEKDSAFHRFPQEIRDRIGHYVSPTLSEIVRKHGLFQHYTQTTTNPDDTPGQCSLQIDTQPNFKDMKRVYSATRF